MHYCPTVSVVMPCYNSECTLRETIESVRNQTITSWELLCVDDGSTDNTVDLIREYCGLDSRIKIIIRESNLKGGSVCRNLGLKAASGSYIMFLDADDILSKSCLALRLENAKKHDCDFCVFPYGTFFQGIEDAHPHAITTKNAEYQFATSMSGWIITCSLFRLDFLKRTGSFDETFPRLQDVEMHLRALTTSGVSYKIFEKLPPDCYYRQSSIGYSLDKLKKTMIAYEKFINLLEMLIMENRLPNKKLFSLSAIVMYGNISMIRYRLWNNNIKEKFSRVLFNRTLNNHIVGLKKMVVSFLNKDYCSTFQAKIHFRLSWFIFIVAQRKMRKLNGQ